MAPMSVKISFMHYMKWIRVMLPVVFEEFKLVCTFSLFFSCHYHCQLFWTFTECEYLSVKKNAEDAIQMPPYFCVMFQGCCNIVKTFLKLPTFL